MLQLTAPSNHRIKILGWSIFFDEEIGDATPSNPLLVSIGIQTGGTGSANTLVKRNAASETQLTTAKDNFTVAATTTIMESKIINAQTGYEVMFPMGQEIVVTGALLFGIDVTPGATISTGGLNAVCNIIFEE